MDGRQRRETERNIRSNTFMTENQADFSGNAIAATKIVELTAKVAKTQEEYQKQLAGDGDIKQDYVAVRDDYDALVDEMRDVRDFANSMAQSIPGLEDKFRLPRSGGKLGMIAAARVFAADAETYKTQFLAYGMDANFIVDLRAKADALENSLAAAEATTGTKVGATDALEIEIKETNKIIEFLDPIVRRVYRANPTKLSAWNYASHVERHTPKPRVTKQA